MSRSNSSLRSQLRIVHILASIALGGLLYSPWHNHPSFFLIMGSIIFPLLTLSGFWMWQGSRIYRWLKASSNTIQSPKTDRLS